MADIVDRMYGAAHEKRLSVLFDDCRVAAAEIERLRAELAEAQNRYERYYVAKFDVAEANGFRAGMERAAGIIDALYEKRSPSYPQIYQAIRAELVRKEE